MSAANTSRNDTDRRVTEGETSGNSSAEGYPHTSDRRTSEMSNDADSSSVHQSAEKISHETEHLQRVPPPEMDTDIKEALAPDLTAAAVASQTDIDNQETQLSLRVSSLSSTSTKEHITAYFEAQGADISVTSVEFMENGTAIVHLVDITDKEKEQLFKKRHKIRRKQVRVEEVLPPQIELEVPEAVPQPDSTHSPSSNILLVSNLPDNADKDLIEMYFEKPKSGGCDGAVESIDFVEHNVVQITLINSEVAAKVMAKKDHKLFGSCLQIEYVDRKQEEDSEQVVQDTLEVSNLPSNVFEDILELYFESPKSGGCDGAVKAVTLITPGVAQVQFSTAETAEVVAGKVHVLNGAKLEVKYSKLAHKDSSNTTVTLDDTLQVSNLPENITEEYLEFYFHNRKSGGCEDAVKEITLVQPGVAKVVLSSAKIAADVLAKESHKFGGAELHVQYWKISREADSEVVAVRDTLEVSNLTSDITKDYLQFYFESPKCGGCTDCVKDITMVKPGVAHVQFTDAASAANVFAKKVHKLQKTELQVKYLPATPPTTYELDKLILQNLPEIEDEYLDLFIERHLRLSNHDFTVSRSKDKALIVFSKEYSINELQKMIKELQARQLKQRSVSAVLYEVCKSILIHNITEHYDEEYLHMYFETSRKSGGGPVEKIHMLGEGQVMIIFQTPKVVSAVLERSHPSLGSDVKIERNDPLHSPTESSNISSVDIIVDPIIVKCLDKHPEPLLDLETVKDLRIELKFDDVNGKVVCLSTKCTKAGWKKTATRSIRSYINSNYTTLSNQSVPKDALQELYGHLSKLKGVQFVFNDDGRGLQVGGEKKVVDSFDLTLKDMIDRYTEDTVNQKFENPANFHFLVQVKLPEMKGQLSQLQINEDPLARSLTIQGTKKEIAKFQEILPKLYKHSQVKVEVHALVSKYIITDDGQMQLKCILKQENTQAAVYITSRKQPVLLCDSASLDSVKGVVATLNKVMSVSEHRVPPSFDPKQEDYLQLCQELEKQYHLQVSNPSNSVVAVAGTTSGVDIATPKLYEFILESCTIDDCVMVERGELRLLTSIMRRKWEAIENKRKLSAFPVTLSVPELKDEDVDPVSRILIRGERDCVKYISREILALKNSICKQSEVIKQTDTRFLTSENGRIYLDGIESRVQVTIEVMQPESSSKVPHIVGSNCYLKCTAKLTEKTSVYVFIGDICDFDGADVIVNAANDELKHIGGVAYALSKKGGPVIDEESTQFIKKHRKLNTGDAWLTTKVGNLPCKALVHTVGPVWNDHHQMDSTRLLESACIQSLQKSSQGQGYRSIAFPAISSGVYGFPINKCAQCMVKAMIKFTNSDTPSNLRSIHFVIHRSNSENVKHFISALEHNLPAGSVSIAGEQFSNPRSTQVSMRSSGGSHFETMKQPTKKSKSASKGATTIRSIPPGVVDCIKLTKGSLLNVQADVYVNTTNSQLNLSSGAVSIALLKAGGKSLQDDCTKKGPIKTGGVAVTGPGQIPCKHIFHTVMPSYDGKSSEKVLKNSLTKCFKECTSRGMTSIAIPSIGTGNLRYPKEVVAKITVDEAVNFLSQKRGSLEFIHLVIFMEDVYRAFQAVLSEYGYQGQTTLSVNEDYADSTMLLSPSMPFTKVGTGHLVGRRSTTLPSTTPTKSKSQVFSIEDLKMQLVSGDITESTCDIIVNPTNSNMKLVGAGVAGAILSKGGQEQQDLCDAVISGIYKLNEDKVVHTKATGKLKCKFIFHINYEGRDLKKLSSVILTCLKKAEDMKMTSIAFPAVGAGTNSCSPQQSATGMLQAIRTFASSSSNKLRQVHIVIYDSSVLQAFNYAFQNPEEAQPNIIRQALNYVSAVVMGGASNSSADPKVVPMVEEESVCEPLEVKIYGETEAAVKSAHHKVCCWVEEKLSDKSIENKYIQRMSEADEERLRKICKNVHVDLLDFDRDSARIRLKGTPESVDKVYTTLIEDLHQYEKRLSDMEHAKQLYELVRWKRMDSDSDSDGEEYDIMSNFKLEMAHRGGETSCTVGTTADTEYFRVDFARKKETDYTTGMVSTVKRIDILKQLQDLSQGEKPPTWDKMPPNCSLHVVQLNATSKEYSNVLQTFDQTMNGRYTSIIQIERIQNPKLYLQYVGRRKEMNKQNPQGHQNERLLFHGTAVDSCPKINQNGFNRSFAGKNAVAYGKGVYFAKNASLSASSTYSPCDVNGYKYIYYVRALTGEFTRGNMSMIVPPHKNANFVEYDSVVDNVANPSIFVIFQDALVYPDYLITFQ